MRKQERQRADAILRVASNDIERGQAWNDVE
jgi:hypothetical protein